MAHITAYINEKLKPYSFFILVVSLVIIFIAAGALFYYRFFAESRFNNVNQTKNFNDVANQQPTGENGTTNTIKLYYFHVNWCPYCVKADPIIQSFKSKYAGRQINGKNLYVIDTDLTAESDQNKKLIERYNITSYPTIFIIDDKGKRIDFDARVTLDNLTKFVNSV